MRDKVRPAISTMAAGEKRMHQPELSSDRGIDVWLPFVLLMLVGSVIFLTENHDGMFVVGGLHGGVSFHGMSLANNLTNDKYPLFMFAHKELQNGNQVFDAYNRFPVFPFLLTGMLTHPFQNHLALQMYAARQLMNLFFFLSIIVAFRLLVVAQFQKNVSQSRQACLPVRQARKERNQIAHPLRSLRLCERKRSSN